MIRSDKDFVHHQLAASGYAGTMTGVLIKDLIKVLDDQDLDSSDDADLDQWVADALHLFRGQPIVTVEEREWADFSLGDVAIRDTVRVKPDAYRGGTAKDHNGKVGRVVGTHGRKISVAYESGEAPVLHEHTALQKLVK